MIKALRFALVAVATFSTVMFAGPAFAGMVSTPKPAAEEAQRDAAKELLKARLTESGMDGASYDEQLSKLSTQDLTLLAGHVQATRNAGGVGLAVAVAAAVVVVVIAIILETFYPFK
jgi:hypothetical protein